MICLERSESQQQVSKQFLNVALKRPFPFTCLARSRLAIPEPNIGSTVKGESDLGIQVVRGKCQRLEERRIVVYIPYLGAKTPGIGPCSTTSHTSAIILGRQVSFCLSIPSFHRFHVFIAIHLSPQKLKSSS